METIDRRHFLDRSAQTGIGLAAAAAGMTTRTSATTVRAADDVTGPQVGAFTKSFQDRTIPEVCRLFKQIGLDGLDLTVRPGGHIDPKNVAAELPAAVGAARDAGTRVLFLTTAITSAGSMPFPGGMLGSSWWVIRR